MLSETEGAGVDDDGVEVGGVEDGGVEDGGVEDGGVDDGGVADGGVDDGGVDDGGVDDGGVEDGGADECGALVGGANDWETIGVGGRDVPKDPDKADGLRNMAGETSAEGGGAEDDARGLAAGSDVADTGAFGVAATPTCGCRWLAAGVWLAPIRAKAATAEPATSPPVRHAEASGREIRCRPGPPVPRRRGRPERGGGAAPDGGADFPVPVTCLLAPARSTAAATGGS
jgi:hypothetical protein